MITSNNLVMIGDDSSEYCEVRWWCPIQNIVFFEVENNTSSLFSSTSNANHSDHPPQFIFEKMHHLFNDSRSSSFSSGAANMAPSTEHSNTLVSEVTINIFYLPVLTRSMAGKSSSQPSLRLLQRSLGMLSHKNAIEYLKILIRQRPELNSHHISRYMYEYNTDGLQPYPANQMAALSSYSVLSVTDGSNSNYSQSSEKFRKNSARFAIILY